MTALTCLSAHAQSVANVSSVMSLLTVHIVLWLGTSIFDSHNNNPTLLCPWQFPWTPLVHVYCVFSSVACLCDFSTETNCPSVAHHKNNIVVQCLSLPCELYCFSENCMEMKSFFKNLFLLDRIYIIFITSSDQQMSVKSSCLSSTSKKTSSVFLSNYFHHFVWGAVMLCRM